jgi:transposase-like protein
VCVWGKRIIAVILLLSSKNTVELVTEKGMHVGETVRAIDIHPNLPHIWRRQFLKEGDKAL